MARLQKNAGVHERTVQAVGRGEVTPPRRRRRIASRRSSRVRAEQVHPLVWEAALKAAHGDTRLLHIVSPTEVWVR